MIRNFFVLLVVCAIAVESSVMVTSRHNATACGVSKTGKGMVIRGKSFSRGDFPWIVALMYQESSETPKFFCAGTLISSNFVISAAHCILDKHQSEAILARNILAVFGAHNLSNHHESGRYSLSPTKIILHNEWNHRTKSFDADLALLEFEEGSVLFNNFIQPICLWNSENEPPVSDGIVTGWGKSEDPLRPHEEIPKLIKVPILTNDICLPGEDGLAGLASLRTFCAGLKNGSGICFGDSGSGLVVKVSNVYYLKGIVSSSAITENNCDISKNAIYTNVLKFKAWIEEKTKDVKKVFCTFEMMITWCCDSLKTCKVDQMIGSENYILGSPVNATIESFKINKIRGVKFLPGRIGEKLPNLKEFDAGRCGLTIVRNHYFKNMQNLQSLVLNMNKIAIIEADSFKDLIKVDFLQLEHNLIETLDEKLFATMIKLEKVFLNNNKIKFLSPAIFNIPGGKLERVNLESNVCVDDWYGDLGSLENTKQLEGDLTANCTTT